MGGRAKGWNACLPGGWRHPPPSPTAWPGRRKINKVQWKTGARCTAAGGQGSIRPMSACLVGWPPNACPCAWAAMRAHAEGKAPSLGLRAPLRPSPSQSRDQLTNSASPNWRATTTPVVKTLSAHSKRRLAARLPGCCHSSLRNFCALFRSSEPTTAPAMAVCVGRVGCALISA